MTRSFENQGSVSWFELLHHRFYFKISVFGHFSLFRTKHASGFSTFPALSSFTIMTHTHTHTHTRTSIRVYARIDKAHPAFIQHQHTTVIESRVVFVENTLHTRRHLPVVRSKVAHTKFIHQFSLHHQFIKCFQRGVFTGFYFELFYFFWLYLRYLLKGSVGFEEKYTNGRSFDLVNLCTKSRFTSYSVSNLPRRKFTQTLVWGSHTWLPVCWWYSINRPVKVWCW